MAESGPMPLLFSYGTLQQADVQLATLGRRLDGHHDELVGFEPAQVRIEDPEVAAALGKTHHNNVTCMGDQSSRVAGTVFEVTDDELARIDGYERVFSYRRLTAPLASGRQCWVYAYAGSSQDRAEERGDRAGGGNTPNVTFRRALRDDMPSIVRLLADDPLGAERERFATPLPDTYYTAFEVIDRDPNNELIVGETDTGALIGVLQLTFIPGITYRGSWRALIEGVRIAAEVRSGGVGRQLMEWAIARARERRCHVVQLTSDKSRVDAIRFYRHLGFVPSHEGLKLLLPPAATASEE
jgi:ribosomal protein S18 acetylase RimI-like enzyme